MLRPFPSSMRAAANTPAEPVGACVARFPTGGSLPCLNGRSASALSVSGPARRSLVLRPAWSLNRPWRPVTSECFRRCRYLHHPLRLLPAGTTVAGRDSHPLRNGAFSRRTLRALYSAWSYTAQRNLSYKPSMRPSTTPDILKSLHLVGHVNRVLAPTADGTHYISVAGTDEAVDNGAKCARLLYCCRIRIAMCLKYAGRLGCIGPPCIATGRIIDSKDWERRPENRRDSN